MTAEEAVIAVTSVRAAALLSDGGPKTDADVLGDLIQPCDIGKEYVAGRDNYTWWWAIGRVLKPRRIAEMGTRFGYSLKALTKGAGHPPDDFIIDVWDAEVDADREPLKVFDAYFRKTLGIRRVFLNRVNTQHINRLVTYGGPPDVVVVDADHSENGAYHDLCLAHRAIGVGGWIVVDDTNPGPVADAVARFVRERQADAAFLPTLRGVHLIT